MKNDPRIITMSLDLYFKGVSQRNITEHLKQYYDVCVHQSTVSRWISKYVKIVSDYVKTLKPEVSGMWSIDEMALKCKGEWNWLWNMMDTESRFLISSMISEGKGRDVDTARKPLQEGKEWTGKTPNVIISNGLQAYKKAIKKEFGADDRFDIGGATEHIRDIAITNSERNNNKVERLNGTVRDSNRVQRGLKDISSSDIFVEGNKIYYNFLRPHMSLDGKTPAEVCGLDLNLSREGWRRLIKLSTQNGRG